MLLKTFGTRLHMKKEYLWIGVGSLLCVLLVTSVALALALFPRAATPIVPRSFASISELAEEKEILPPDPTPQTKNSKLQTPDQIADRTPQTANRYLL